MSLLIAICKLFLKYIHHLCVVVSVERVQIRSPIPNGDNEFECIGMTAHFLPLTKFDGSERNESVKYCVWSVCWKYRFSFGEFRVYTIGWMYDWRHMSPMCLEEIQNNSLFYYSKIIHYSCFHKKEYFHAKINFATKFSSKNIFLCQKQSYALKSCLLIKTALIPVRTAIIFR